MSQSIQKVALITGAATGIGRAIAIRLAKDGISIAVNYIGDPTLAIGDLEKVLSVFSPEAKWCQPGNNQFAGIKNNLAEITAMFRGILNYTSGNLQVRPDGKMMKSGSLVAVPVWFTAKTESNQMNLGGLDLFEVENGKIIKVWTFSDDQYVDDKFFGQKKP